MRVDFIASEPHYRDHIRPIEEALPDEFRGDGHAEIALVASYSDLLIAGDRPIIFMEHGVGFRFWDNYNEVIDGYAGAADRRNVELFLCPNAYVARANRAAHPGVPARIVGCPKLDVWHSASPKPQSNPPTVAFAFHWPGLVSPGTASALPYYRGALPDLTRGDWDLIGHGHPRHQIETMFLCSELGIDFVPTLDEVFLRADLLVADATSAMYEFASLNRPVVTLNTPEYHEEPDRGLRFWKHIPGIEVERPEDLTSAVAWALEDLSDVKEKRRAAVEAAYPIRGNATEEAVYAITDFIHRKERDA